MRKIINKARETPKQFSALLYHIINLGKPELGQAKWGMYNSRDRWGLDPSGIAIKLTNWRTQSQFNHCSEYSNKMPRKKNKGPLTRAGSLAAPPPAKTARLSKIDRLNSLRPKTEKFGNWQHAIISKQARKMANLFRFTHWSLKYWGVTSNASN